MSVALFGVVPVACLVGPESAVGPCADQGCDDGNPCTDDTCAGDGFCDHAPSAAPPDDGNDCTDDVCKGTEAQHRNLKDLAPCGLGGGLHCDSGVCVCTDKAQCGEDTVCVTFACTDAACVPTFASKGTAVDNAGEFDCKKRECDGVGHIVDVADVGDVPADDVDGDCKKKGCDADGEIITVADVTDPPADEPNPCTTEGCDGETPIQHTPVDDGTMCAPPACVADGGGFQAFAAGSCAAGACAVPPAGSCGFFACDAGKVACRTTCGEDGHCIGGAFCQSGANLCIAKLPQGQPCQGDNQCANNTCRDGYCCNGDCAGNCARCDLGGTQGTCINPVGQQGDCNAGSVCDANAQCKKSNGESCGNGGECNSGFCPNEGNSGKVCCNEACDGTCRSCLKSKTGGQNGTCGNITNATDPENECQGGQCSNGSHCCNGNGGCTN